MIRVLLHGGDCMLGRAVQLTLPHQAPNEGAITDSTRAENYLSMAMHCRQHGQILPVDAQAIARVRRLNADGSYLWGDYVDDLVIQPPPDLRILNLETAVTETITNKDIPRKGINYHLHAKNITPAFAKFATTTFRAPRNNDQKPTPSLVPYVVSFANNHAMDFGRTAFERESLAALKTLPGDAYVVGAGINLATAQQAARIELLRGDLERRTVSVIAATTVGAGTPYSWAATARRSGMVCLPSISSDNGIERAIEILTGVLAFNGYDPARRPYADVVVLSIHWGPNWAYRSSLRDDLDFQRCRQQLAHRVIRDLGVDLIYGHSSHHIRGMEVFDGKLIVYGAGDLINDYEGFENAGDEAYNTLGALFLVDIHAADKTLASLRLIPTTVDCLQLRRVVSETVDRWRPRRERREEQHGVLTSLATTINKYSRWDVGDHGRAVRLRVVHDDPHVPGGAILMYP